MKSSVARRGILTPGGLIIILVASLALAEHLGLKGFR